MISSGAFTDTPQILARPIAVPQTQDHREVARQALAYAPDQPPRVVQRPGVDIGETDDHGPAPLQGPDMQGAQSRAGEDARIEPRPREQVRQHRGRRRVQIVAAADAQDNRRVPR